MTTPYQPPRWTTPVRVLIMAAANADWYQATDEERRSLILPRFAQILGDWRDQSGAQLIGSFDDDFFMVGTPVSGGFSMYMILEIESPATLVRMLDELRKTVGGVRLDRYLRMEARIGRGLFLLHGWEGEIEVPRAMREGA